MLSHSRLNNVLGRAGARFTVARGSSLSHLYNALGWFDIIFIMGYSATNIPFKFKTSTVISCKDCFLWRQSLIEF